MKRLTGWLAGVLALTVLLAAMTGCGGDGNDKAAATPTTEEAAAKDPGSTADEVAALEADPEFQEVRSLTERSTTYVGTVDDTDAYIAIVDNGAGVITAYVCDGSKVGAWAEGKRTGDEVSASGASGLTVDATITGSTAAGEVVLPSGDTSSFSASLAKHPAGLWQPFDTESGEFAGLKVGWIVLADGSQRGLALTSQKQLNTVDPVNTVGGTAGSSTGGPVTTLSLECATLHGLYLKGFKAVMENPSGSSMQKAGTKLMFQVSALYEQAGCPGNAFNPASTN